jgi:hypothetical protein
VPNSVAMSTVPMSTSSATPIKVGVCHEDESERFDECDEEVWNYSAGD